MNENSTQVVSNNEKAPQPENEQKQLNPANDSSKTTDEQTNPAGDNSKTADEQINPAGDNSKTTDEQINPAGDNSKTTDEQTNPAGDNSKTTDEQINPAGDNSKTTDEQTNPAGDNSKTTDEQTNPAGDNSKIINEQADHPKRIFSDSKDELNPQIINLKTATEQLIHEKNCLIETNTILKNENACLKNTTEKLNCQIGHLQNSIDELNRQIVSLKVQLKDQIEASQNLEKEYEITISRLRNQTMEILNTKSCLNEQERCLEKCFQRCTDSKRKADQSNQQIDEASDPNQDISKSLQDLKNCIDRNISDISLNQYLNLIHKLQFEVEINDLWKEINEDNLFNYMVNLYNNNPNDPQKSMVFSPLRRLSQHQLDILHEIEDFDPAYLSPELCKWMLNMIWKYCHVLKKASKVCHLNEKINEKTDADDLTKEMNKESKKLIYLIYNELNGKMIVREGVEIIDNYLFKGETGITSVILPHSLKKIGLNAFYQCSNLTSIDLKCSNLISIGAYAFADCGSLKKFILPQTIKIIDEGTFRGCKVLQILEFPQDLEEIRDRAFEDCNAIESVILSPKFKKLGREAFKNCQNLSMFVISGVVSIVRNLYEIVSNDNANSEVQFTFSKHCFEGCRSFVHVHFDKIKSLILEESAFYNCTRIITINLNLSSTMEIQNSVFGHCSSLTAIVLPQNCKVGNSNYLCDACETLSSIQFPEGTEIIPIGVCRNCSNLELVKVGNQDITSAESVTQIRDFAFQNNPKLNWTQLPPKLETIGKQSFENGINIKVTSFPQSIKTIGEAAFSNSGLEEIRIQNVTDQNPGGTNTESKKPSIGKYAFSKCLHLKKVYIDPNIECSLDAFSGIPIQPIFTNCSPEQFKMCNMEEEE